MSENEGQAKTNTDSGTVNPGNSQKSTGGDNFDAKDFIPKRVFNEKNEQWKAAMEALEAATERANQFSTKVETLQKERDQLHQQNTRVHKEYKIREVLLQEGAYDPTDIIPLVDLDKVEVEKMADTVKALKEQKSYLFKNKSSANNVAHKPTNGGDSYGFAAMSSSQVTEQFLKLKGDERSRFKAEYDAFRKGH